LIVEGETEYAALPLLHRKGLIRGCPPLKAKNLRGLGSHLVPLGVAKAVVGKVIAFQEDGIQRVVLCVDREQRVECAGGFAQSVQAAITAELVRKGRSAGGVCVVVADRAFEAWLLADAVGHHKRGTFVRAPDFQSFEGSLGRQQKKGTVELDSLLGRPYVKTSDGPRIFEQTDFVAARSTSASGRGSRSLDKFLRVLGL
jgi:hypothetical protein